MAEKTTYHDSISESINFTNYNDKIKSPNDLTIILNLSHHIAKQIKEQAIDTIKHSIDLTS
jgi:hypothetical protein